MVLKNTICMDLKYIWTWMRILVALQAPLNSKLFTKYNFFGGITSVDVPSAPHVWFHARKNAYIQFEI